ncbi:MAG: indole-3-glycerol phosphate synthase TrpC [Bacteroidales bacterium]
MTPHADLTGLLAAIVATARVRAASMTRTSLAELERRAVRQTPRGDLFLAAITRTGTINVIAECKRRSPLKGVLRREYRPAEIALEYERAGAAAVSVLTEPEFFDGSLDDLQAVKSEVAVPVLRKDFIVDERQLIEARAAGADAVLLIVAALGAGELTRLAIAARELGLAALVEVHDAQEVDRALEAGAAAIGVNARDLRTMQVSLAALVPIAARVPCDVARVAESGITSRGDIATLKNAGYSAFLVGERLMTSESPGVALAALLQAEESCS